MAKNPIDEETCQGCINQKICPQFCGMCFPLFYENEIYGVIHITARTKEAEADLFRREKQFAMFMCTICDLITLTIRERQDKLLRSYHIALQDKLINVINDGVMILDENNEVQFINDRCAKVLGYRLPQIRYLTRIRQFSVHPLKTEKGELKEYQVCIRETKMRLTGHTFEVDAVDQEKSNTILVFYDIRGLHGDLAPTWSKTPYSFKTLIGDSPAFHQAVEQCREISYSLTPVLLVGEIGCGKEMFARAIHNEGTLRKNQFVQIAHAGTVRELVEKSVFQNNEYLSGEQTVKNDILEGNTLYIDEVSQLGMENQRILCKIIENSRNCNNRVICGTSKPLDQLRESGDFYPELYYALENNAIIIPPLRLRDQDVLLFAKHYLEKANKRTHKNLSFGSEICTLFLEYRWIGNIREVENTVTYIVERAEIDEGELTPAHLPAAILKKLTGGNHRHDYNLKEAEKRLIIQALNELGGHSKSKSHVAAELGISTATLYRKLKEYGIDQTYRFDENSDYKNRNR